MKLREFVNRLESEASPMGKLWLQTVRTLDEPNKPHRAWNAMMETSLDCDSLLWLAHRMRETIAEYIDPEAGPWANQFVKTEGHKFLRKTHEMAVHANVVVDVEKIDILLLLPRRLIRESAQELNGPVLASTT